MTFRVHNAQLVKLEASAERTFKKRLFRYLLRLRDAGEIGFDREHYDRIYDQARSYGLTWESNIAKFCLVSLLIEEDVLRVLGRCRYWTNPKSDQDIAFDRVIKGLKSSLPSTIVSANNFRPGILPVSIKLHSDAIDESFERQPSGPLAQCPWFQLKLRLRNRWGNPFAGYQFRLVVEEQTYEGTTGTDGSIEVQVRNDEGTGLLDVWLADPIGCQANTTSFRICFGSLEPANTAEGIQARLQNQGYDVGAIDGQIGPRTKRELQSFQARLSLRPDSEPTAETSAHLQTHNEDT